MIRKASLVVALRLTKDEVVVQVAVEEISVVLNPGKKEIEDRDTNHFKYRYDF